MSGSESYVLGKVFSDENNIKCISRPHYEVHEGEYFHVSGATTSVPSGSILNAYIELESTSKSYHMTYNANVGGSAVIRGYEVATTSTLSSTGTAQATYNRNRGSSSTSNALVSLGVGSTSDWGSQIYADIVPGTTSQGGTITGGGSSREGVEWILHPAGSTRYYFELENIAADPYIAALQFDWYEDTL